MLPSKSITPLLGIWHEQARLFISDRFRKATVNEEKVLRAFARSPSISHLQQGISSTYYARVPWRKPFNEDSRRAFATELTRSM